MEITDELRMIRKLVIIALFSDDDLMDVFVLKGGNALDIAYSINSRASIDIDISMESDFRQEEMEEIRKKLERALTVTFHDAGYAVFDVGIQKQPLKQYPETKDFWGGYTLEFKIIESEKYKAYESDIDSLRRNAKVIGDKGRKKFKVDISKYEFCKAKVEAVLDDYTIYVYTPLMVVYEKLRAICQQMDEYVKIVGTHKRGRAKDFFDIYTILEEWKSPINIYSPQNLEILKEIFEVKRVPLYLLGRIGDEREFHRDSFNTVKDAVYADIDIKSYDFYFDYVVEKVKGLKSFWKE